VGRIVVMSGYPAAGKSTLARALAERLDLTYVCKDGNRPVRRSMNPRSAWAS